MGPNLEIQDFIHPRLGQEITAIGGHYVFNSERRLSFGGRDILYLVGYAVVDTSCCGVGGCAYAMVPGYVRAWKYKQNETNEPVSQIEAVCDIDDQVAIRQLIQKKETVQQVTFGF
jgi:hypothetical protein